MRTMRTDQRKTRAKARARQRAIKRWESYIESLEEKLYDGDLSATETRALRVKLGRARISLTGTKSKLGNVDVVTSKKRATTSQSVVFDNGGMSTGMPGTGKTFKSFSTGFGIKTAPAGISLLSSQFGKIFKNEYGNRKKRKP